MRKLVLGIVVVGLLHFAFLAYIRVNEKERALVSPEVTVTTIPAPAAEPEPPAQLTPGSPAPETAKADGSRPPDSAAGIRKRHRKTRNLEHTPQRERGVYHSAMRNARPADFATVVIGYGRPVAAASRRNCGPAPNRTRSLIAAAPSNKTWTVFRTIDPRLH